MSIVLIVLLILIVIIVKTKENVTAAPVKKENTTIVENEKKDEYVLVDKYAEMDMSAFSKEYFDWETTPTLQERNIYAIKKAKDLEFINSELKNQIDFISEFTQKNYIRIPVFKSNQLPTEKVGYSKENEICTFSFTPFTPTGRVKNVNYAVSIDTFPGEPEIDFSKLSLEELRKRGEINSRDGFIFGSMEFDKTFNLVRSTYHHWECHKRTTYTLGKRENEYIMKKLVKQGLNDLELGKPEKVIVKDNCLL